MNSPSHGHDNSPTLITGIYAKGKGNFGFVDVEDREKGYFIFGGNSGTALPGDRVQAKVKIFKGREEATIIKVIERRKEPISGVFQQVKGKEFGFVVPSNPDFIKDIFIPARKKKSTKNGDMVAVEITGWTGRNPEGKVIKKLGKTGERGVDILAIAIENGARLGWNDIIQKQASTLKPPSKSEIESRTDLRNILTFTIDGADSKDLDDAISIEIMSSQSPTSPPAPLLQGEGGLNYKLSVHIADVTHYVTENSPIDQEAQTRGTSIYLVDKVIPMLPEKLSNGLCSLNPHETKLSLTCEMLINSAGHIMESKVYESVIESDYRLTYEEVDDIVSKKISSGDMLEFGGVASDRLVNALEIADNLQSILTQYKTGLGVLGFDFPEPKIELDDTGHPIAYKQYPKYRSNKMIEEFMVSANESVSKQFHRGPFVYRTHEAPDIEDLEKLYKIVSNFGYTLENIRNISPKDVSELLNKIAGTPHEKLLGRIILRSLKKANYTDELVGHFGLALNYYSHFTSPIRRYPDLQIHRIIKESLASGGIKNTRKKYYQDRLPGLCQQNSQSEIAAQGMEYKIRDMMAAKYMQDKIGQSFTATISGVMQKGFFVELDNTIEGYIRIDSLDGFFEYREDIMELKCGNTSYQIGQKIEVELVGVDMILYQIDFELKR